MLAFLALGMWIMHRIVDSLLGRTFMAIRNSDELAEALGIDLMRNKLLAFVLSVVYAGLRRRRCMRATCASSARTSRASSTPST